MYAWLCRIDLTELATQPRRRCLVLARGGGTPSADLMEGLEVAAKQLRGPIGRALRLRHAPELVFEVDEHLEEAIRVTHLLDRLAEERREREGEE